MNNKIAAVVVAYNPDPNSFQINLSRYAEHVDVVLLWCNSKFNFALEKYKEKVILCGTGENVFIAKALNYALLWCRKHDYDWLLTMDQDSCWSNCKDFISFAMQLPQKDNIAIFCPNINKLYSKEKDIIEIESAITSGSLYNVKVATNLGGFREDYEIYWVDSEYCVFARKNDYKIILLPHYNIEHQFGNVSKGLFGFEAANYTPLSYYYLFRNMIWMRREYKHVPSLRCICYTSFIYVRGILMGENKKIRKLRWISKALLEGLFGIIPRMRM